MMIIKTLDKCSRLSTQALAGTLEPCASIQPKKLDFLEKEIDEKVCHVQIDINGICEKCGKKP